MSANPTSDDHRSRTGARRREQTRRRLVESAVVLFAQKGGAIPSIDEVVGHAGISRGSFYNYFTTNLALIEATAQDLLEDILHLVHARVKDIADPAERVAVGLNLMMKTMVDYPAFTGFTGNLSFECAGPTQIASALLPPHLAAGIKAGRFVVAETEVFIDLIEGVQTAFVRRMRRSSVPSAYIPQAVATTLRGLGLSAAEAERLAALEVEPLEIPPESLIGRTHSLTQKEAER